MTNTPPPPYRVAVVVPALATSGGVAGVARFVYQVLQEADGYEPSLLSVPLSSDDPASVRLTDPGTWTRGVQVREGTWEGHPYRHVGAMLSELEFQRYRPRSALTEILNRHDLVQIVAGTPAWALLTRNAVVPVALQVATLARVERESLLADTPGLLGLWRRGMVRVTDRLDHHALQYTDRIFVENDWMRTHLADHVDNDRLVFAPPGVDTSQFAPGDVPPSEGGHLLSVGRLADPRKNIGLLFEAYAHLRAQMADPPPLVLAGRTGPSDEAWAHAQSLGVREQVTFHEDVSLETLVDLYRTAACYVVSSDEEGLGLTILEAMACGRPVVSTRCGGPSTVVVEGETGRLVPTGAPQKLADAIRDVLTNPDTANRMGRAGRTRIENEFSVDASKERFLRGYETLLRAAD
ncbi:glycosyltransferase family 4 protein [Salinibacter ruber]|uniref:glycosyltransferase family 4 protein n=1 Tax=Salinibacter ruber TaxID=146919 RepID=UPI002167133F|nr:glycosyltransferase involved in cell wall biosynthesis [Salinibacter ruber]